MIRCCDKHASEHEDATFAWIEAAGMRLIPIARATRDHAVRPTGDYVLIHSDGKARPHQTWESAVREAELVVHVTHADTPEKLKYVITLLLTEYQVMDFRQSLEGGIFAAVDAFATAARADVDLAKMAAGDARVDKAKIGKAIIDHGGK